MPSVEFSGTDYSGESWSIAIAPETIDDELVYFAVTVRGPKGKELGGAYLDTDRLHVLSGLMFALLEGRKYAETICAEEETLRMEFGSNDDRITLRVKMLLGNYEQRVRKDWHSGAPCPRAIKFNIALTKCCVEGASAQLGRLLTYIEDARERNNQSID